MRTRFAVLLGWLLTALVLPGTAGPPEDKLVIITPHWAGIRKEYEAGFQRWLRDTKKVATAVKLEWLTGQGSSDIYRQIESDFVAKRPTRIDVVFGGGVENFINFARNGYLQKAPSAAAKAIPAELRGVPLRDKYDLWHGAALSAFGLMYNNAVLAKEKLPTPKEWSDLARPEYRRFVGATDPRHSGSFHMMCEIMLQANGWDRGWEVLTGMMANARSIGQAAPQVPRDVARGEVAVGAVIDFYARQEIAQAGAAGQRLGYVIPVAQTVITPDPIAILKGAPHRKASLLFVEYVLSEGQKLLVLTKGSKGGPRQFTLGRLPMLPALYDKAAEAVIGNTNPFKAGKGLDYSEEKGSARRLVLSDLIGALLVDNHAQLQRAWSADSSGARLATLAKPPITEAEALELAKKWKDPLVRNQTLARWQNFARAKYQALQ